MRTTTALLLAASGLQGCSDFFVQRRDPPPVLPLRVTETWVQEPLAEVDVLWVVDNTPSMEAEHEALGATAGVFLTALEDASLSWQVGVITTELDTPEAGLLQGVPWIITPSQDDPAGSLARACQVGLEGASPAGGLGAVVLALTEPARSGANRGFRRPGAALHVVVFSDGDDESDALLGPDPVEQFGQVLEGEAAENGRTARLSAVVGDPGAGCLGERGQATPGDRYAAAAAASGGVVGSICTADWDGILDDLGSFSAEYSARFALQALPEPGTERVTVDGEPTDAWFVDADALELVFETPPPADAQIRMTYVASEARADSGGAL